ncbi:hypothetical protein DICVIV_12183 [Dictyocaulus viviparus]|uniref:Prominin n=1 Tax=Dictyocaulus viviparus TaxID=29172 RepID=A0A0D8XB49_DICVI|nr:hypothetical protein DICVIV_12183 [Dictyocaulus viviparus]
MALYKGMMALSEALQEIRRVNIPKLLNNAVQQFATIQNNVQKGIDEKIHSLQMLLKKIADNLFLTAEKISTHIRQINFDVLYDIVYRASDDKEGTFVRVLHHSRTFFLIVTSIFMLIAFCFLLGLFYGICGRRPTFYNDDCCVRSTGEKFYSCGTWLAIATFTVFSVLTASLFFVVGNTSDIVCRTLRDPLSRPDILSLGERYLEIARSRWQSNSELLSLMSDLTVLDLIRSCQSNETLYKIFELDNRFQLTRLKVRV